MNLRLALHELAAQHQLSPDAAARLKALAQLDAEPPQLDRHLPYGMAILGALLGGLGIVFWVAANWESLSRAGRFGLLQAVVVVMCAGAFLRPAARVPLALLALMATGGLFAYFGQTYQTGADAWELFVLWAVLTLPLCLGVRHDALWTAWVLVAMSAIALWLNTKNVIVFRHGPQHAADYLIGWSAALLVTFALSPVLQSRTGAGAWAFRGALTFTTIIVTGSSLLGLFDSPVALHFWLGLAMLAGAATAFCTPRLHDTYALSAIGLGLNTLLVGALVRLLFDQAQGDSVWRLMVTGIGAAGLLAMTVKLILMQSRTYDQAGAA